jgi:hypothetical protein
MPERILLLLLTLSALLIGTAGAVLRPFVFRLGQEGTPPPRAGVIYRGAYRSGRWQPRQGRGDWGAFQGRGPGGAK